ncbi:MAG: hypothetical protein NTX86_03005 [Candidatus Dependentiae bacterium]|nr:hypothetical protein [Candidatus Dependentiae bacterium]
MNISKKHGILLFSAAFCLSFMPTHGMDFFTIAKFDSEKAAQQIETSLNKVVNNATTNLTTIVNNATQNLSTTVTQAETSFSRLASETSTKVETSFSKLTNETSVKFVQTVSNKRTYFTGLGFLGACAGMVMFYKGLHQTIDSYKMPEKTNQQKSKSTTAFRCGLAKITAGLLAFGGGIFSIHKFGA